MEELNYDIAKWKEIGLLDGIPEDRHENAVKIFNVTLNHLIKIQQPNEQYETAPMMVIHRILRVIDINEKQTLEIIDDFKKVKFHELDDAFPFLDAEALMCEHIALYAEMKLKELQK